MSYKFIFGFFLVALISLSFSYDQCPKAYGSEPICTYWVQINQICKDGWGLDPYFVSAIAHKESDFNPLCVNEEEKLAYDSGTPQWCGSYYGKGILQLTGPGVAGVPYPSPKNWKYDMPAEADPAKAPYMDNAFDPAQSFNRGCWFLKALSDHYSGDLNKVASAYRYGWQDVDQIDGLYVDPNNNGYVQTVMKYYNYYKANSVPEVITPPPAPTETTTTQPPAQQEPAPTQTTTTTETTTTTTEPSSTQTTTLPAEETNPVVTDTPNKIFCDKLKEYLETKYDKFFKKLYGFLGKDCFSGYCENIYYPLLSMNKKQLKKVSKIIGLN
ncbi:MAG: transglycosylase SLT domain-containing protein [Candidatus ainarchaeum sp.]|nr:transglycosylase SLT domain-containing protein [Candidatus ainarchaeum sp.]